MGIIYKIENDVTHKVYIGQSVGPISDRVNCHFRFLQNGTHPNRKLSEDFNRYGAEHFNASVICECANSELSFWEKFYIQKYDSYDNGYNLTHGGSCNSICKLYDSEGVKLLQEGMPSYIVEALLQKSPGYVRRLAEVNNINMVKARHGYYGINVSVYNEEGNLCALLDSISSGYYLCDDKCSLSTHQHKARAALLTGVKWMGYYWVPLEGLEIEVDGQTVVCQSFLEKEYISWGGKFKVVDGVAITDIRIPEYSSTYCKFCGVKTDGTDICESCIKEHPRCGAARISRIEFKSVSDVKKSNNKKEAEKANKRVMPSDLDIANYLLDCRSKECTAQHFNISTWKVKCVIDELGIPNYIYDNRRPVQAYIIENGKKVIAGRFDSLKDAVTLVWGNSGTKASRNTLRWRIGEAAKNGNIEHGYFWEFLNIEDLTDEVRRKINKNS